MEDNLHKLLMAEKQQAVQLTTQLFKKDCGLFILPKEAEIRWIQMAQMEPSVHFIRFMSVPNTSSMSLLQMATILSHSFTFYLYLYCDPWMVSPSSLLGLKDHAIHCDAFPVLPGPKRTLGQGHMLPPSLIN